MFYICKIFPSVTILLTIQVAENLTQTTFNNEDNFLIHAHEVLVYTPRISRGILDSD